MGVVLAAITGATVAEMALLLGSDPVFVPMLLTVSPCLVSV